MPRSNSHFGKIFEIGFQGAGHEVREVIKPTKNYWFNHCRHAAFQSRLGYWFLRYLPFFNLSSIYWVGLKGLHGFELPSAATWPPTVCLTAIFGKIGRKDLNHVKAFKSSPVEEGGDAHWGLVPGLVWSGVRSLRTRSLSFPRRIRNIVMSKIVLQGQA